MEDNWKRGTTLHPESRFDRSHQKRGCATVTLMLIPVSWEQRKVHWSTKEGVKGKSLRLQWIYQHEWINGKEEIPLWGGSQCHYQQKLDSTSLYFTSLNLTSLQVYEQEGGVKVCSKKEEGRKKVVAPRKHILMHLCFQPAPMVKLIMVYFQSRMS